jgi:hypothetical protein
MQLLQIEHTIFDSAKIAVSQQVVLLVGIERPRNNVPKHRFSVSCGEQLLNPVDGSGGDVSAQIWITAKDVLRDQFMDFRSVAAFATVQIGLSGQQ